MAIEDAIAALRDQLPDVIAQLGEERGTTLIQLIGRLGGTDRSQALVEIADLLVEGLPREHPVRRALIGGTLLAPGTLDWPGIIRDFQDLVAGVSFPAAPDLSSAAPQPRSPVPGEEILAAVTGRLLRAPALGEPDVRGLGVDPDDPGLVRLTRPDGQHQWPAFQFGADGSVPAVVRSVNRLLGAQHDPVGTGDWWLSRNGWLQDVPARLIGIVPDDLLLRAAQAVSSEV
jgi:hypothetical protein